MKREFVTIIGAGLAGCEAAYQIAKRGIKVWLVEAKPKYKSPAHHVDGFSELVCSNSLKSNDPCTAHGLLKAEMNLFGSLILDCAEQTKIPAGGALAVDRDAFSKLITQKIKENPLIEIKHAVAESFSDSVPTILATGPLTLGGLADCIKNKLQGHLSFFDAAAPIVSADSIDTAFAFSANRYGKGGEESGGDYLNCPLSRDEYYALVDALTAAERAELKNFDQSAVFEGCMPVEVMAARGRDVLRFGPLKPVGLADPATGKRPFAVVQLRKENMAGEAYNLVGFQTNLKFQEQKRVFGLIPALKNAEFLRYGVMHRNSYIDAPKVLKNRFQIKDYPCLFVAGQLSGVEGYVESAASGLLAGIDVAAVLSGETLSPLPDTTILGALCRYLITPNANFQPMNANFGLLPPLDIRDKTSRKQAYAERSLQDLARWREKNL